MHAHVPAHEADDGDDDRLPQQRGRLTGVGPAQPSAAVQDQPHRRGLDGGQGAHGGRQQPWAQWPQHGHGDHRESDLAAQRAHRVGEARAVRPAPALHGERADGDQRRAVQDGPARAASLHERDEDRDDDGRAAHQDAGDGRFGGTLGGQDGEVEADHADGGEQGEAGPLAGGERAQAGQGTRAGEGHEQQAREAVAQGLSAGVRVVAQDAVGGEGRSDEDAGERGEEGATRGGDVHEGDVRKRGGPV
ncbi:hypothetical protein GCM10010350_48380 [Streptomyces galilaeus]|nr:hypothetical protein GCM10010350_48380 [Streptomyces galilaeus]